MKTPKLAWITVFGLGHRRPASGTWGSLPPVALAAGLYGIGVWTGATPSGDDAAWSTVPWLVAHGVLLAVFLAFCLACIVQADEAEAFFHRKDPSQVVADETAGQCLPLMFLPAGALASPQLAALTVAAAFFSFRFFDIVKPWPARHLQRIPGGWGILIDDLFAGLYAAAFVQLIARTLIAP